MGVGLLPLGERSGMLENNCDSEGRLGDEDMPADFVCGWVNAIAELGGEEERKIVDVPAILAERTARRRRNGRVRFGLALSGLR